MPVIKRTPWTPIKVTDLRMTKHEPGECERCHRRNLRFVHTLEHPIRGALVNVGRECALRLCSGYLPEREEAKLRSRWGRRTRYLSGPWRPSRGKGNPTLTMRTAQGKVCVTLFPSQYGGFGFLIMHKDHKTFSHDSYPTVEGAKLGAFETLADQMGW